MDKLYQYVSTKENVGINLCRISIAIVFMWIGLLKFIPDLDPPSPNSFCILS